MVTDTIAPLALVALLPMRRQPPLLEVSSEALKMQLREPAVDENHCCPLKSSRPCLVRLES
jgi:hypothetical protein